MLNFLLAFILLSTCSYAQVNNSEDLPSSNPKIFLFGEAHSVKEKYDEIKTFIFESLDTVPPGQTVTMFFELPSSLNYAINKIKVEKDTTFFLEFFNHLYKKRGDEPSYFWQDFRDIILALLNHAESKEIELKLICIDIELEFRRTAFILSSFDNKINTKIDSLLNIEYLKNDTLTRSFLLDYIEELSNITNNSDEIDIIKDLKSSLIIDCTICRLRERFMFDRFIEHYDPTDAIVFGNFGLDHIVNNHDHASVGELFKWRHKIDTVGYVSLFNLLQNSFNSQITRIGIIALYHDVKFSNWRKPNRLEHLMMGEEREYIEMLFKNESVLRLTPSEHDKLNNLSTHLDYLVVYKSSNFR